MGMEEKSSDDNMGKEKPDTGFENRGGSGVLYFCDIQYAGLRDCFKLRNA